MQYRPEVDGLRALAVLPVILYHAKLPYFQGGFVGVDVFFVSPFFLADRRRPGGAWGGGGEA